MVYFSEQICFIGALGFVPHVVFVRLVISFLYVDNVLIYYLFLICYCYLLDNIKHLQMKTEYTAPENDNKTSPLLSVNIPIGAVNIPVLEVWTG